MYIIFYNFYYYNCHAEFETMYQYIWLICLYLYGVMAAHFHSCAEALVQCFNKRTSAVSAVLQRQKQRTVFSFSHQVNNCNISEHVLWTTASPAEGDTPAAGLFVHCTWVDFDVSCGWCSVLRAQLSQLNLQKNPPRQLHSKYQVCQAGNFVWGYACVR